jgi:hypothetical protein
VELDENVIKVIARFTPIGKPWPTDAWIYLIHAEEWARVSSWAWRRGDELSELEANQKGIFRNSK